MPRTPMEGEVSTTMVSTIALKLLRPIWKAGRPVVVGGKGRQPSSSAGDPKCSHKGDDSCRQQLQPQRQPLRCRNACRQSWPL